MPNYPMPVAQKILLQLAVRNIGQLTDIEPLPPSTGRAGGPPRPRSGPDSGVPVIRAAPVPCPQ